MKDNKKEDVVILLNGKPFKVPPGGSLGLLTLGSKGIRAWRQAKKEWEEKNSNEEKK
jgi:hypothetical protein